MPLRTNKSMFGPAQTSYATLNTMLKDLQEKLGDNIPKTVEDINIMISHFNTKIEEVKQEKKKVGTGL